MCVGVILSVYECVCVYVCSRLSPLQKNLSHTICIDGHGVLVCVSVIFGLTVWVCVCVSVCLIVTLYTSESVWVCVSPYIPVNILGAMWLKKLRVSNILTFNFENSASLARILWNKQRKWQKQLIQSWRSFRLWSTSCIILTVYIDIRDLFFKLQQKPSTWEIAIYILTRSYSYCYHALVYLYLHMYLKLIAVLFERSASLSTEKLAKN